MSIWDDVLWEEAPYVAFDTDSTGFSYADRICEIALVVMEGNTQLRTFHSLVNPEIPIPADSSAIHGLTDEDVRDAPVFRDILEEILKDYLDASLPWVAHNLGFDTRMLRGEILREKWPRDIPTLCTMDFAKKHKEESGLRKFKLADLTDHFGVLPTSAYQHQATADALLVGRLVPKLMKGRKVGYSYTRLSEGWLPNV